MRIKDILDKKGSAVRTIGPEQTVVEAISQLCAHRIGALVVVGAAGKIEGIITERDVLHECGELIGRFAEAARAGAPVSPKRVKDVMTKSVIIGVPEDSLDYVMGVMTKNRVRHLPVVADGKLIGIISIGDVVNANLRETSYENRLLKDYIHGAIAVG
jgi:CBS domain-containing protein